eukprot:2907919-Prymnesium_polylepis.2
MEASRCWLLGGPLLTTIARELPSSIAATVVRTASSILRERCTSAICISKMSWWREEGAHSWLRALATCGRWPMLSPEA